MEHHVYFWLKPERQNDPDRREFESGLAALFTIDLVKGGMWATPAPVMERPVIDHSWDYALSMRFDSIEDQDVYQTHPEHDAFIARFKDWWENVQVRDLLPGS
jgi:hypothetical protein